ncbi:hypothetical protein GCM10022271_11560 [Corallibacter vietnamensis]|uniref:Core-binding (CB) domain-containing protein n=1 Tax=Corallibacter vietnamensis TaxID=904130 RepID=A0ABP7H3C4_9FLAO
MKPNYNEPKIYTGGADISQWSKLSKKEQNDALKKDWYVYYSFRNPDTGYMEQQKRIKGEANRQSTKTKRLGILKPIQRQLMTILEAGYNPYSEDNSHVRRKLMGEQEVVVEEIETPKTTPTIKEPETKIEEEEEITTLKEAKNLVLETKKKVLNENSYPKYRSRINQFYGWLKENGFKEEDSISRIKKRTVLQYLNYVLQKTSPRNRNNTRNDLSSFFSTLYDNDLVEDNFVMKISKLTSKPKRNKSYSTVQLKDLKDYMNKEEPILSLFVDFVTYGLLRPMEVCRLKVGDIDIVDKKMQVEAKNQLVKVKIIPQILLDRIPDLSKFNNGDDLFTPTGIGGQWDVKEGSKRDYFSSRFKRVKDHFGLGKDFGLYSFRHTTISKAYKEILKEPNMTPIAAKSKLMLITGHTSLKGLENYLRNTDAVLPEDFSHLLKE